MDTVAQIISIIGLAFIVASYQQKKKSALIVCQLFGCTLFSLHFLLLKAYTGCLLNALGIVRALVYYKGNLSRKAGNIWVAALCGLQVVCYGLSFLVFGTEPTLRNFIVELLPTIGMCALTISFNLTNAGQIRALGTVNSGGWLVYNILHRSIGGVLTEIICLVSITIGFFRYDRKRNNNENTNVDT